MPAAGDDSAACVRRNSRIADEGEAGQHQRDDHERRAAKEKARETPATAAANGRGNPRIVSRLSATASRSNWRFTRLICPPLIAPNSKALGAAECLRDYFGASNIFSSTGFAEVDRCVLPRRVLAAVDTRDLHGEGHLDAVDFAVIVEIGLRRNAADGGVDGDDAAQREAGRGIEPNPFAACGRRAVRRRARSRGRRSCPCRRGARFREATSPARRRARTVAGGGVGAGHRADALTALHPGALRRWTSATSPVPRRECSAPASCRRARIDSTGRRASRGIGARAGRGHRRRRQLLRRRFAADRGDVLREDILRRRIRLPFRLLGFMGLRWRGRAAAEARRPSTDAPCRGGRCSSRRSGVRGSSSR